MTAVIYVYDNVQQLNDLFKLHAVDKILFSGLTNLTDGKVLYWAVVDE